MKAQDLRIGNYVLKTYNNKTHKIVPVNISIFSVQPKVFKPIPLTEEWLLKFGFNRYDLTTYFVWYRLNDLTVRIDLRTNEIFVYFFQGKSLRHIKHVYQLQNLYFALTGEELKTKL